jgi:hypothetical protein
LRFVCKILVQCAYFWFLDLKLFSRFVTEDPNIKHKWWAALGFAVPLSLLLVGVCVGMCYCNQKRRDDKQKLLNQTRVFETDADMQYPNPVGIKSTEDAECKLWNHLQGHDGNNYCKIILRQQTYRYKQILIFKSCQNE